MRVYGSDGAKKAMGTAALIVVLGGVLGSLGWADSIPLVPSDLPLRTASPPAQAQGGGGGFVEGFERGTLEGGPLPWETFGASDLEVFDPRDLVPDPDVPGWRVVSEDCYRGEFCVRSGLTPRDDLRGSVLALTVTVLEAGEISFWVKNESEAGFDGLLFFLDGEQRDVWTGNVPWEEARFPVSPGEHTFQWVYVKDVDTSVGGDAAWLDDIQFPPLDIELPPERLPVSVVEVPLTDPLGQPQTGSVRAGSFSQGTVTVETPEGSTEEEEALLEFSVEVPEEGAQILAVLLESKDGGNLDLYGKAGSPVIAPPEAFRVLSDFAALSPGGVEILMISNPQPETTYWFIVENPESFDQRFEITAWLLPEIRDGSAGADGQVGVPANLPAPLVRYLQTDRGLLGLQQYRIQVPKGAERLQVELEGEGEGDLNLHVRFGEPVAIDEETGQVVADVSAVSPSGSEILILAGSLLREGSYYLAVEGLSPPQEFLLTITLRTPEGRSAVTLGGRTEDSSTADVVHPVEF